MKNLNNKFYSRFTSIFIVMFVLVSCSSNNNDYLINDANRMFQNKFMIKTVQVEGDCFLLIDSIISFELENPVPDKTKNLVIYTLNTNFRVFILDGPIAVFGILTDVRNKFIAMLKNGKDIQNWAKAISGIHGENWFNKYALGAEFKDISIKSNRIYVYSSDGGSGSTGGFNIEHVFTITNGKPVTLVSRFVPNPEKEKAIKAMQDRMK